MKQLSPFTGKEMLLMTETITIKYRGEPVTFDRKYFLCEETGEGFTTTELDNINFEELIRIANNH